MHRIVSLAVLASPLLTYAHEGHGADGAHWHATDVWGFVALAVAGVALIWFNRKK